MKFVLLVITGILTALSFPTAFGDFVLPNLGFLGWISLVPLFYLLDSARPVRAFLYTFISAAIWYSISLYWVFNAFLQYGRFGVAANVASFLLLIIIMAAYISIAPSLSVLFERKAGVPRLLSLPILWVACEFARNYFPGGGFPWGNITNSQFAYIPIIQSADIFGIYGLTALMIAFNLAVAESLFKRRVGWGPVFVVALAILNISYGIIRVHYLEGDRSSRPQIKVAALQGNVSLRQKILLKEGIGLIAPYRRLLQENDLSDIDLVVWPETAYPSWVTGEHKRLPRGHVGLDLLSLNKKQFVLTGALFKNGSKRYNSLMLLDGAGNIIGRYDKMHLVPFAEYVPFKILERGLFTHIGLFSSGEALNLPDTGDFKVGGLICYEDVFPELARREAQAGADILAVVSNDSLFGRTSAPFQHVAFSVFRAIENRRYVVRSANSGISAIIDDVGRIVSRSRIFEEAAIVSDIKLGGDTTLYTRYGDWFAWVCVLIGGLTAIILSIIRINTAGK